MEQEDYKPCLHNGLKTGLGSMWKRRKRRGKGGGRDGGSTNSLLEPFTHGTCLVTWLSLSSAVLGNVSGASSGFVSLVGFVYFCDFSTFPECMLTLGQLSGYLVECWHMEHSGLGTTSMQLRTPELGKKQGS